MGVYGCLFRGYSKFVPNSTFLHGADVYWRSGEIPFSIAQRNYGNIFVYAKDDKGDIHYNLISQNGDLLRKGKIKSKNTLSEPSPLEGKVGLDSNIVTLRTGTG